MDSIIVLFLIVVGGLSAILLTIYGIQLAFETHRHIQREITKINAKLVMWRMKRDYPMPIFRQDSYGRDPSYRWTGKKYELN